LGADDGDRTMARTQQPLLCDGRHRHHGDRFIRRGPSQRLRTQTFDEYLAAYHTDSVAHVPDGCDGGDPSTWPAIQIGDKVGRLQMQCNAADAFVEAGGRIYIFELGNATFETLDHFSMEAWKELLKSVVLDPKSAR